MVPFGTRFVWTSGTFFPDALRHPEFLVSYEIKEEFALGSAAGGCAFPVAVKMTFRAPVQRRRFLPWRLFLDYDGHYRLCDFAEFGSPREFAATCRVACTKLAGQTNHAQQLHHSAAGNVGNLRWHLF